MVDKYDLLLKANVKNDRERLIRIAEFDQSVGGMKLYRYRPLNEDRLYELDALEKCRIWSSNPNLFDDEYELCTSSFGDDDYKYIEFFVKRDAKKNHRNVYHELSNLRRIGKRNAARIAASAYRENREKFVVSCFTENSPTGDEAMWHQYADDRGFCLEYSLKSLVEAHVIIDPVYYLETKSFGDIFRLFGESERAMLMFCVKDKYGVDKCSDTGDVINWEQQREWRYLLYNERDKEGRYKPGLLGKKIIMPDRVYVKGLDREWIKKVKKSAEVNGIPVKEIDRSIMTR